MAIRPRRRFLCSFFLAAAALPCSALASDCAAGLPAARVEGGSAFERASACEGVARAYRFFKAHGLSPALDADPIVFKFQAIVRIPCLEADAAPDCEGPRVAGLFDASNSTIVATLASEPWMRGAERDYFRLPYDDELYTSVMAHEATHAMNKQFFRFEPDQHGPDEYIAYASQLWSLDPATRERLLARYPGEANEFRLELNINDISHYMAPHAFGVMSYRHFLGARGGAPMMERIYSGDFRPPTMD